MGLDMYLNCNDRELVKQVQEEFWRARRGTVFYWRKAYAIHKWFIDHCAYVGEDNCKPMVVGVPNLRELHETCEKVLEDHSEAPELLPSQDGFFFGSTEYDEWYFKTVEHTRDSIGKILELLKPAHKPESNGDEYMGITWADDYYYTDNDWIIEFQYVASW